MEKSITTFTESLDEIFRLSDKNWNMYSPLTLAYIGDAVCEIVVRTLFVKRGNCQVQKLHQRVTACVSAKAQSGMIHALMPYLTPEEASVFRRGRNSKPFTKAKNASMTQYLEATGFEAVLGYLYLNRSYDRLNHLMAAGLKSLGIEGDWELGEFQQEDPE